MGALSPQVRLSAPDRPLIHRAVTLAVVVAVHILLLLLLLRLTIAPMVPTAGPLAPILVELLPDRGGQPAQRKAEQARPVQGRAAPRPAEKAPAPVPDPPVIVPDTPSIWSKVIPMTRQEMAAADIGSMPSRGRAKGGSAGESGAAGGGEGGDAGPGRGPNGEALYNAEWYRRPTRAELAFYIPSSAPEGWGMIACQTVAGYRVEDCIEIAESPPGSGLASAVRQAAWQFRVHPPRRGGRALVGEWVRIRIEYSVTAKE